MEKLSESLNPRDYPVIRWEPSLTDERRAREIRSLVLHDYTAEAAADYLASHFPPVKVLLVGGVEVRMYGGADGRYYTIPQD